MISTMLMPLFADSSSSSVSASSSSATTAAEPSNIGEWFSALWASIVKFLTTGKLEENTTSASLLGRIIVAIVVFVIFFYINKFVIYLMNKGAKKSKSKDNSAKTARLFIISVIKALLMIILVTIVLAILGFDLTGLSTIISSAIVAIGLSLQNIIANFASGIIILTSKNFVVGDYIDINSGQVQGTVKDVTILTTKIVTVDNVMVYVPNSTITSGTVQNFNVMRYRRINLTISASYDSDVQTVKKIIRSCLESQDGIIKEMPINVVLTDFGNSAINFAARCYVPTPIYWDTVFALNEKIYEELLKRNVDIPYNQMDVHVYHEDKPDTKTDGKGLEDVPMTPIANPKSPLVERSDEEEKKIDDLLAKAIKPKKGSSKKAPGEQKPEEKK